MTLTQPTKKGHKHADKMMDYARDAAETDKPWELWQVKGSKWLDTGGPMLWDEGLEYRRKPRTITLNGREIEAPLREAPSAGATYYVLSADRVYLGHWVGVDWEREAFKLGRIFATKEAAQAAHDAITSLLVPKE